MSNGGARSFELMEDSDGKEWEFCVAFNHVVNRQNRERLCGRYSRRRQQFVAIALMVPRGCLWR